MNRRRFLHHVGGMVPVALLAGCAGDTGGDETTESTPTTTVPPSTPTATPTPSKPGGIYVQSFQEQMSMQGTAQTGDYAFALMFAVPHTFWTVTGSTRSKTTKSPEDSLHLMATVWDPETGTVLPETGLSVEITQEGDLVSQEVIYPMLSQPMGFHYGGNFSLPGDGTYTVTVSVGGTSIRRTGSYEGRFGDPASVEIPLEFTETTREEAVSRPLDGAGNPGALTPMDASFPVGTAPTDSDLPGTVRASAMTDGARLVVTTLDEGAVGGDDTYLAVSARTRYNDYVLPAMALSATLERDGTTVYDGPLARTLDSSLDYHYGAAIDSVESGDELTITPDTPPQVARHEGYETAFLEMEGVSVTL